MIKKDFANWPSRDSVRWVEEMSARADRWVQDPSDRKLLVVPTFDESRGPVKEMREQPHMYGEWVRLEDFQALAERFVLAWELITTSEDETETPERVV